jgi:hypothetical protein
VYPNSDRHASAMSSADAATQRAPRRKKERSRRLMKYIANANTATITIPLMASMALRPPAERPFTIMS